MNGLIYFLELCFYSAAFLAIYAVTFRGKSSHRVSRVFLLLAAIIPTVLPFLKMNIAATAPNWLSAFQLQEILVRPSATTHTGSGVWSINWLFVYVEISVCFLAFYALAYLRFFIKIRKNGKPEIMDGRKVYKDINAGPGSIWTSIFFPGKEVNPIILRHELAHIYAGHRYDLLFLQVLNSVFWLNPFYWLLCRELKNVHEYEADAASCQDISSEQYAELLLSQHFKTSINIAHSFFHHPLKQRIIMIQQRNRLVQSGRITLIAAALSVSVGVVAVFAQNTHAKKEKAAKPKADQNTTTVYKYVEQMPRFNGNLGQYLSSHLHYPDSARAHSEEGRCIMQFVVDNEGTVKEVQVVRTSNFKELDGEAVRVVSAMPAWIPGEQDGKKVAVYFTLPVTFKLE